MCSIPVLGSRNLLNGPFRRGVLVFPWHLPEHLTVIWPSPAHFPTELKQCRKFLQRSDICGDVCLTLLPNLYYQGLQSSWTDFKDLLLSTVSLYDVLLPVTRKNTPDPLPVRRKLSNLKLNMVDSNQTPSQVHDDWLNLRQDSRITVMTLPFG